MSNESFNADETKVISLFGILNGAIQHKDTPKEIKTALSGSLANVLMDDEDRFGFKDTELQQHMLGALRETLLKLMREEQGNEILNSINLN